MVLSTAMNNLLSFLIFFEFRDVSFWNAQFKSLNSMFWIRL